MQKLSYQQIKSVFNLSLPMAASRFIQMFGGFIGMIMLSRLGRMVLAASALVNATLSTVLLIFISIIFAVSFVVGQMAGAGAQQYQEVGKLVQQSLVMAFLLSLCMMLVFWFVGDILILFRQTPLMVHYVQRYFHALMWGAVPLMLQACIQQFMYGILKQRLVITINLVTLVLGVLASYILIFGHLGIPAQGIAGLGYAFALQSWFGLVILLFVCFYKKEFKCYALFSKHSHDGFIYFRKVFQVGWPMSLQFGGELLAFFVISMMIGWLGPNALAAVQVTQQWLYLVIVPIFAMSEAAGILIGRAVGAKQYAELRGIGYASLIVVLGLVLILDFFFITFPHLFASLYINIHDPANAALVHVIRLLFLLLTLTLIFNAIRDVTSGLLRGLYDTRYAMRIGLLVMWCFVLPLGYFMAFKLHLGVIGFKLGGNIGLGIGAIVIWWRWRLRLREYEALLVNA